MTRRHDEGTPNPLRSSVEDSRYRKSASIPALTHFYQRRAALVKKTLDELRTQTRPGGEGRETETPRLSATKNRLLSRYRTTITTKKKQERWKAIDFSSCHVATTRAGESVAGSGRIHRLSSNLFPLVVRSHRGILSSYREDGGGRDGEVATTHPINYYYDLTKRKHISILITQCLLLNWVRRSVWGFRD